MTSKHDHWEQIYANKLPAQLSWYQSKPTHSLQLIRNAAVPVDAPIIDVGGGASILVDFLIDEGYTRLAVLDISARALAYARQRLGEKADLIEWYQCDVTEFVAPHRFTLWHDRAVFHFLTEAQDRRSYVRVLKRTLVPGGQLIIGAFGLGGPTKCSGLDCVRYDDKKLLDELNGGFELAETRTELHITPAGKAQEFAWFRCLRSDTDE